MSFRHVVAVALCLASASAVAQTFDINLSNDAAMLTYMTPLGQQGFGHGQLDASVLFTDNDNFLADLGLGVVGAAGSGSPGLTAGVGVKLYSVTTKHNDVVALALGGQIDYSPPVLPRMHLSGAVNLAPSIVTFMDGDLLFDGSLNIGYEIFQNAIAYFGFRKVKVNIQNGNNVTVDSGGYLGVKFKF
jgi:YfaZ precursor